MRPNHPLEIAYQHYHDDLDYRGPDLWERIAEDVGLDGPEDFEKQLEDEYYAGYDDGINAGRNDRWNDVHELYDGFLSSVEFREAYRVWSGRDE